MGTPHILGAQGNKEKMTKQILQFLGIKAPTRFQKLDWKNAR